MKNPAPLTAHDRLLQENFGVSGLADSDVGVPRRVSPREVLYARITLVVATALRVVAVSAVIAVALAVAAHFVLRHDRERARAAVRNAAMRGVAEVPQTIHLGHDLRVVENGRFVSLVEDGKVTALAVGGVP